MLIFRSSFKNNAPYIFLESISKPCSELFENENQIE